MMSMIMIINFSSFQLHTEVAPHDPEEQLSASWAAVTVANAHQSLRLS